MTNDIEAAARAYLAAYDVESSNSEMWYRAVVDARDALRAALARETPTPPTPAEGRGEEAIRADERERCAKVCEKYATVSRMAAESAIGKTMIVCLRDHEAAATECAAMIRSLPHGDGGGKGAK